jgi:hypothetical protein
MATNVQSQLMSNQYHLGGFTIVPYGNGNNFEVFKAANNGLQPIAQDINSWRQFCGLLLNQLGWLKGYNVGGTTRQRASTANRAVAPVQTGVTSGASNVTRRRNVSGRTGGTRISRSKTPTLAASNAGGTVNSNAIPT